MSDPDAFALWVWLAIPLAWLIVIINLWRRR